MAKFQHFPSRNLGTIELNYIQECIDDNGFRKALLQDSISFGLIKNSTTDPTFSNGRVTQDTGSGKIQIAPLEAIDNLGNFIHSPSIIGQVSLVGDSNWYWVKVAYAASNLESGTCSISTNGSVTGTGTEFTKILRGGAYTPTSIRFQNSVYNTLTYKVLQIISDTSMQLANPAVNGGLAEFMPEDDLTFACLGTTVPGVAINPANYYPFIHDGMIFSIDQELTLNTPPAYVAGQEFYIARVYYDGISNPIIQDKRSDFWETKGSQLTIDIDDSGINNLIGVESSMFQVPFSPADSNLVSVGWGMRSYAFSINTNSNVLTISSGLGGRYKSVADYTTGDFVGWRVYTANGQYSRVISSSSAGGAILLQLDHLDADNYTSDGSTPISQTITVVPNAEEIIILCTADITDNVPSVTTEMTFPIYDGVGVIPLECYKATCLYNVQYRYKKIHEYTGYQLLPSDTGYGYLAEVSFSANGVLLPIGSQEREMYTSVGGGVGYITLQESPYSYANFHAAIDKNDLIGVENITALTASAIYPLVVGTAKNYQYIGGTQSIGVDTSFNLSTSGSIEGNEFRIHFNCTSLNLAGHQLTIKNGSTIIKTIGIGDVYQMLNQDGGIVFDCKYDSTGNWKVYQNYDLGQPFEIKMVPGNPATYFDPGTGYGIAKGWYGWQVYSPLIGRTPIGLGSYTEASGTYVRAAGDTGGEVQHKLVILETPSHTHAFASVPHTHTLTTIYSSAAMNGVDTHRLNDGSIGTPEALSTDETTVTGTNAISGGDGYHENMPPWLALTFAQKQY